MEEMIKQQTLLSGYIARLWTNFTKLGQARMTTAEMRSRLLLMDEYWKLFQERHFNLMILEGIERSEYHTKDLFLYTEEAYFQIRAKFTAALESATKPERGAAASQARTEGAPESSTTALARQMQLPKINLPKFSGDVLAWESFRDLFQSLVHDVADLPKVQKLQYLKSSLAGEALAVIGNVPLTDAEYDGAWKDLLLRYDNPRVLLFSHMRNLISCPPVTRTSPAELKRLLGVFAHSSRAFKSLKRPVETWDDWFVHLLVCKLDSNSRLHWETSLANSRAFPTFATLQDYLENRIRALEAAKPDVASLHGSAVSAKDQKPSRVSANAATTAKVKQTCPLCTQSHAMQYCAKFKGMSVEHRHAQVKRATLCLNCMRPGHSSEACIATGRCLVCGEKHHTMLHGVSTSEQRAPADGDRPAVSSSTAAALSSTASCLMGGTNPQVLLATARIILESESGRSVEVRALLDPGSDASFVTEWVAQQLSIKRKPVNVTVVGLQGTKTGKATTSVVVTVRSPTDSSLRLPTEAFVLRKLTDLLPANRISAASWPHIEGLSLADPNFNLAARVDAILGADVYAQVLEPAVCRGAPGTPTAQLTTFGWVLIGRINEGPTEPKISSHRVSVLHSSTQLMDDLTAATLLGGGRGPR